MTRQSLAKATRLKHLQIILNLSRFLKKDWKDVTRDDIDELIVKIVNTYGSSNGQETNTTWDHKKILKIFFKWFKLDSRDHREVGDPTETKSVKLRPVKDKIIREDLLVDDDISRMLYVCGDSARDRAFIHCHYEAGTRPSEILSMRIKHVKFDKYGAIFHVDGKTGPRIIRLIKSVPDLAKWLDVHPSKSNPEAPLWIVFEKHRYGLPLTYGGAKKLLQRRAAKCGLGKRIHLNIFRHSEATSSAKFMTEAQMRKRHGWSSNSKMPSRYVHLINADVDDAIFEHYGIKQTKEENLRLPIKCAICDFANSFDSVMCSKCGRPLDIKTVLELEEKEKHELESTRAELERIKSNISNTEKENKVSEDKIKVP